jgi:AcrR family transcriptional regulator
MDERFRDRMRRERTDVILRETAGLASEQGWVALRVEDVARRAGIAKGTIYLDFKDKDELIMAAIRRSMGELLALMRAASDGAKEGDRLGAALGVLTHLPVERPDLAALLRCTHTEETEAHGALDEIEGFLTGVIQKAQRLGDVGSEVDPEFAAQSTLAAASIPSWSRIAKKNGPDALLSQLSFAPHATRS